MRLYNRSRRGGARSREARVQAGTTGVLFPPPAELGTLPGAPWKSLRAFGGRVWAIVALSMSVTYTVSLGTHPHGDWNGFAVWWRVVIALGSLYNAHISWRWARRAYL